MLTGTVQAEAATAGPRNESNSSAVPCDAASLLARGADAEADATAGALLPAGGDNGTVLDDDDYRLGRRVRVPHRGQFTNDGSVTHGLGVVC